MDIAAINEQLTAHEPDHMVLGESGSHHGMLSNKPLERASTTGHERSTPGRAGRSTPSR